MSDPTALADLRRTAEAYRTLAPASLPQHDWAWRAERTLADLEHAPSATVLAYGDLYAMPYVAGQYPDSMVQLQLVVTLRAFARARGRSIPIEAALRRGMHRFFDASVGTLRRYLPNVGAEKDYDAVDSWYLYHPLANLARLAIDELWLHHLQQVGLAAAEVGAQRACGLDFLIGPTMTAAQVRAKLESQGYTDVHDVEFENGVWTADARSADGTKVDVSIDPKTGKVYPEGQVAKIGKEDVEAKLAAAGYTRVHDVEMDDGVWKADATDPQGRKVEVRLDPATGEVIGSGRD